MKEGDIYSWRWRDDERHADSAPYRSYHCRSRIAVYRGGALYDTFWSSLSYDHVLREQDVVLTLLGNENEMTEIPAYQVYYYRDEDIVDMRHSNNSRGPIYLKAGATRNADVMREEVERRIAEARSKIESGQRQIERMNEVLASIRAGDLSAVYF